MLVLLAYPASVTVQGAPPAAVTLTPNLPSGQLVGTPITWSATAQTGSGTAIYRFSVARGAAPMRVVRDFRRLDRFTWTPMVEGTYRIKVTAREGFESPETTELVALFEVTPRVRAGELPVVSPTGNALTALYSAPPCAAGSLQVAYRVAGSARWDFTPSYPCQPSVSMNLYVVGMRETSTYDIQQTVTNGTDVQPGPMLSFTTGVAPPLPSHGPARLPDASTSQTEDTVLFSLAAPFGSDGIWGYATDLAGRPIWYYNTEPNEAPYRPLPGGRMLLQGPDDGLRGQILREIDMGGNSLRETNVTRLNEQISAIGGEHILAIHHDAVRTPGGLTLLMGYVERMFNDVQGEVGPVDVLGNAILALDQDWQLVWYWNAFDHFDTLDINRAATLGDVCVAANPLCPPLQLAPVANDWLHVNSIVPTPDGHLLISIRNQDWLVKIHFAEGTGTGDVLWRLGLGGDFMLAPQFDPYPWFSHQHDASYVGTNQIVVFDNGNVRCQGQGLTCQSRGQMYTINETTRRAALTLNAYLGSYSNAWGSAARLSSGNFVFNSGKQPMGGQTYFSDTLEVLPDGTPNYVLRGLSGMYRSYRLKDLYGR